MIDALYNYYSMSFSKYNQVIVFQSIIYSLAKHSIRSLTTHKDTHKGYVK